MPFVVPVRIRRLAATLLALAVLLGAARSQATDPDRVEWSADWPRLRVTEVVDIAALTVASYAIDAEWKAPSRASWQGGILFDDSVRGALRGRGYDAQSSAAKLSDTLYLGGVVAPYLVDVYVVALGVHQNADVAIEMLGIDMQSLGLTGVVALASEHAVGRARPYVQDCGPDGTIRDASGRPLYNTCGTSGDNQSFFSGHAAATATMAGLTCVHHQHLPLYGGGLADLAPCVAMIGLSVTTGVARVVADRHWASDVLLGWGVGAVSGYVLPSILHYGFSRGRPLGEAQFAGGRLTPVPQAYVGGAGLALTWTH